MEAKELSEQGRENDLSESFGASSFDSEYLAELENQEGEDQGLQDDEEEENWEQKRAYIEEVHRRIAKDE